MSDNNESWSTELAEAGNLDEIRSRRRQACIEDVLAVCEWLDTAGIKAWLHGGWAVEGLVRKLLEHEDVDFFVMAAERARLEELLGGSVVLRRDDFLAAAFGDVQVDFGFLSPYGNEKVVFCHRDTLWVFPDPNRQESRVLLGGRLVSIVSPAVVLAEQEHTVRKKRRAIPKMRERAALLRAVLSQREIVESRSYWPYPKNGWNNLLFRLRLLHLLGVR